jgi:hypothetical protein
MNESLDPQSASSSEFFFRPSDRLQLESCITALAKGGKNVVMYSRSNELLDYYGSRFLRRLKKELPSSSIEVFMPPDTEAMLNRFNQLLSNLSLDVATKPRTEQAPEKLWVVHDASVLGAHELELFARLVMQFPGCGVSAVLMFPSETAPSESLTRQNKQFVSWGLEMPTDEQKLNTIQQARKNGNEEEAVAFFNRIAKGALKKDPLQPTAVERAVKSAAAAGNAAPELPKKTKRSGKMGLWVAIVAFLLSLSLGVTAWLHPEVTDQALTQIHQLLGNEKPAPEAEKPAAQEIIEEKAEPAVARDEANNPMPAPASATDQSKLAASSDTAAAATSTSSAPAAQPAPAAPVAAVVKETPAEKVITELPDVAVQARNWLKGLPEESFVIEYQVFNTVKDAQAATKGKEGLQNARIAPVFSDGKDQAKFAVVIGPFKSKERAQTTITRLGLPSSTVIKAVPAAIAQASPKQAKP